MNILIVKAHPSPNGVTHSIANTYAEVKQAQKHEVQIVDLYAPEYEVPLLKFNNIREFEVSKVQKKFHEQITWANEIVVIHPIWWGTPPSIMKNWTELAFWPRVAYRYLPGGKVEKMLTGKTAKIFATAGNRGWWHHLPFMPLLSFWRLCLFGFCGVDVVDVKICGSLDKDKDFPEKRIKRIGNFLEKIKKSAEAKV